MVCSENTAKVHGIFIVYNFIHPLIFGVTVVHTVETAYPSQEITISATVIVKKILIHFLEPFQVFNMCNSTEVPGKNSSETS